MVLKNIMPKEATDKSLLTYDEYHDLMKRFNSEYTENDELNPKEFLDEAEFSMPNRSLFRKVLDNLLNHIRNRGMFMSNEDKSCSYISYILAKDLQNKGYAYKPQTFKIFQDFVRKYNSRPGYTAEICSNTLLYVISEMYEKMNNLYVLYEEYQKLKTYYLPGDDKSCPAVNFFLLQYKDFINKYPVTDRHYKNVLENFRNIIHNRLYLYNQYACIKNQFRVDNIKFSNVPESNIPKASVEERQQNNVEHQVSAARSPLPEARSPLPEARSPLPEERSPIPEAKASQIYLAEPARAHEQSQAPQEVTQSFHETLVHSAYPAVRQEEKEITQRQIPERELNNDLSPGHEQRYGLLVSPRTSSSAEHYSYTPVPLSSNEVELPPSSFMNTITSTLKNVDPVPVVGVSGGMGVLFLLFRYTPVGTFFRGRGYRQRIPTRFDGAYPGFLPGFQGFEEGYFPNDQINIAYGRE